MYPKIICVILLLNLIGCTGQNNPGNPTAKNLPYDKQLLRKYHGIEFTWVPPGERMIGTNNSRAHERQKPQVLFELEKGFYIGCTEVTAKQFQTIVPDAKSLYAQGDYPVKVDWETAKSFCEKLNELRIAKGEKIGVFRLPYEYEWEYVALHGRPSNDDWWPTHSVYPDKMMSENEYYEINSDGSANEVKQLKPNVIGVYDVLGNVSEWCNGYFAKDVTSMMNHQYDKTWHFGNHRPLRGGNFLDSIEDLRPSIRSPKPGNNVAGFRVLFDPFARLGTLSSK